MSQKYIIFQICFWAAAKKGWSGYVAFFLLTFVDVKTATIQPFSSIIIMIIDIRALLHCHYLLLSWRSFKVEWKRESGSGVLASTQLSWTSDLPPLLPDSPDNLQTKRGSQASAPRRNAPLKCISHILYSSQSFDPVDLRLNFDLEFTSSKGKSYTCNPNFTTTFETRATVIKIMKILHCKHSSYN